MKIAAFVPRLMAFLLASLGQMLARFSLRYGGVLRPEAKEVKRKTSRNRYSRRNILRNVCSISREKF